MDFFQRKISCNPAKYHAMLYYIVHKIKLNLENPENIEHISSALVVLNVDKLIDYKKENIE